ncbi:MAG: phytanoyl-CoA dioxygenase family protein [Planctomycetaceae bacterium]
MNGAGSSSDENSFAADYLRSGFAVVAECLKPETVDGLSAEIEAARVRSEARESVANSSGVYALRNLTDAVPATASLMNAREIVRLVHAILGPDAFMIRSTLFDKTDGANWGVFWHQDLSIAVLERHDVPGFTAWTRKAAVDCVQPPADLMNQIVAVRLHLDDCQAANGALKVLPGTHLSGRLNSFGIDDAAGRSAEVLCEVPRGGAVLMNPLTLHASSPMTAPGHRRVIHFEFAAFELPEPLQWKFRIPCGPNESRQLC